MPKKEDNRDDEQAFIASSKAGKTSSDNTREKACCASCGPDVVKQRTAPVDLNPIRAEMWRLATDANMTEGQMIKQMLEAIGPKLGVCRVSYNVVMGDNAERILEWRDQDMAQTIGKVTPGFLIDLYIEKPCLEMDLKEALAALPQDIRDEARPSLMGFYNGQAENTILGLPLHGEDELEGILEFETCMHLAGARIWTDERKALLPELSEILHLIMTQRRTSKTLTERTVLLEGIFNSAQEGIFVLDDQGSYIFINPACGRIVGHNPDEWLGRKAGTYVHPDDHERSVGNLLKAVSGSVAEYEARIQGSNGVYRLLDVTLSPLNYGGKIHVLGVVTDITEKRQAIEKITESEKKYRDLVERTPQIVLELDLGGKVTYANPFAQQTFGYSEEEYKKTNILDYIHPDEYEHAAKLLEAGMSGGDTPVVLRAITKQRQERWILNNSKPIMKDGKQIGLAIFGMDITKSKQVEETLRHTEAKYSALVENSKDGIAIIQDGKYKFVNKASAELLGYQPEELIGKDFSSIVAPEHIEITKQRQMARLSGKSVPSIYEINIVSRTGVHVPIEINASIILYEGKPAVQIFIRDLRERKKTDAALKESEGRFKLLFEESPSGIALVDMGGVIREINQSLIKLLMVRKEDVVGRKFADLTAGFGLNPQAGLTDFKERLTGGAPLSELTFLKNGKKVTISVQSSPIIQDGKIISVLFIINNITERKRAEEALRESEEKFRVLFEASTDAIMTLEPPVWNFTSGNPATVKMFRANDEAEFVSQSPWNLSPEFQSDGRRSDEKAKAMIMKAMQEGSNYFDWDHKRIGGEVFPATVMLTRVTLGSKVFLQATVRDITERKKAEDTIKRSEAKYSALIENTKDAIVILQDGKVRFANKVSEDMTGRKLKDIVGSEFINLLAPKFRDLTYQRYKDRMAGKAVPPIYEVALKRNDGSEVPVEINASLIEYEGRPADQVMIRDITQRKKAEEALRESEEKYRTLFNQAVEGIMLMSIDGKSLYLNEAYAKIHGYDNPKDMEHLRLKDLDTPETFRSAKERMERMIAGEALVFEVEHYHKDGHTFPLLVSCKVVDVEGKRFFLGFHQDITDRKKAEAALRESENRYRILAEAYQDMIYIIDREDRVEYVNEMAARSLGKAVADIIGHARVELFPPQIAQRQGESVRKVLRSGQPTRIESQICYQGHYLWQDTYLVPLKDESGKVQRVLGVSRDITHRKDIEEALRSSEEKLRTIIENTMDFIHSTAPDGKVLYISPNVTKWGFTQDEIIGHYLLEFVHPDDAEGLMNDFKRTMETGEEFPSNFRLMLKGGKTIHVEEFSKCVKDQDGNIVQLTGIIRDVTERKKAEDALKESEERYRLLVLNSPDMTMLSGIDGKATYVSPQSKSVIGHTPEEIVGMGIPKFIHPEDMQKVQQGYEKVASGGELVDLEYRIVGKEGAIHWVSHTAHPVMRDGKMTGVQSNFRDITFRKRAEEEIQWSEKKYRLLAENSKDVIWTMNLRGGFTYVSPSQFELSGYTAEEVMRSSLADILTKGSYERCMAEMKAIMGAKSKAAKSRSKTLNLEHVCKDGHTIWTEVTIKLVRDESGMVTGLQGTTRDITERKKAEDALKDSEERYRELVENLNDVVFSIDPQGIITYISPSVKNVFGYTAKEVTGQQFLSYVDEGMQMELAKAMSETMQVVSLSQDVKIKAKNGAMKWIHTSSSPIFAGEVLIGRRGIMSDITEKKMLDEELKKHKDHLEELVKERTAELIKANEQLQYEISVRERAEKALRSSETKNRAIIEALPDMMFRLSEDGTVLDFKAGRDFSIGTPTEKIIGKNLKEMAGEHKHGPAGIGISESLIPIAKAMKTKKSQMFEAEMSVRGQMRNYETRIVPSADNEILAIVRDVTARKRIEEEMKKAEKLQSLGILAGGIAHDFNNILTALVGNITYAKMQMDPKDKGFEKLVVAEKAALKAKGLTTQLLTYSKGGAPIKRPQPIGRIITESSQMTLEGSSTKFQMQLPEDLWDVEVDESQMAQVFNNLILNASQAMNGQGSITVSGENLASASEGLPLKKGRYVKITVRDTGVGIPAENLTKIFDPFYSTKTKGVGLGLAICYSIVKSHSGHIAVESSVGTGTSFHLYIPAVKVPAKKKVVKGKQEPAAKSRILIMDDDQTIREIMKEMLTEFGYEVEATSDGREAVDKYKAAKGSGNAFDAVVLDLTVPGGLSGKDAMIELRAFDPSVRAIVSSGYSSDDILAEYWRYGFRGVVTKPFKFADFYKVLQDVLAGK